VSAVVFVNRASETPGPFEYAGGRLALYGLIDEPPWRDVGFEIDAERGLLVAFDSATVHEVTPVAAGRRLSVVDWFY
jgi:predicted 2-oxoglutarate/Fe(II)-dependent dioxygenase YbiX